jgi:hypothetical protein
VPTCRQAGLILNALNTTHPKDISKRDKGFIKLSVSKSEEPKNQYP